MHPPAPDPYQVAAIASLARLHGWIREHNRTAVIAAATSLLLSAASWGLLYVGGYALLVVGSTVSKSLAGLGTEAANSLTWRPLYGPAFLAIGSLLTLVAAVLTHWWRAAAWYRDLGLVPRAAIDFVLWPASLLVDGLDTLRALVRLRAADRPVACALLAQLDACGGRLALAKLSLEVPDRPRLLRVLQQLHLAQVLSTRMEDGEPQLCWCSREAGARLAFRRPE